MQTVVSFDADENFKNMLEAEGDLAKKIEAKDMAKIIGKILSQIRIDYREVLMLRFMEDKDYNEISDILKKPVGTIGTLLNRAKKELKNELEKNNFKL